MRRLIPIVTLLLIGCSTPKLIATKRDMSNWRQDNYQCTRESTVYYGAGGTGVAGPIMILAAQNKAKREANELYTQCMEVRGYTVSEE